MGTQRGFVPLRKLGGGPAITKLFPVSAATNDAYFLGDAVIAGASGKVRTLKNASTARPLGVIVGLLDSNKKPLTFSQPTRGPFLATAAAGYALVNCDPNQTYVAQIDVAITDASRFAAAKVSAGAPSTATGLSGQVLSGTIGTSADSQFIILGLAPEQYLDTDGVSAATPALIEVLMNNPQLGNGGNVI